MEGIWDWAILQGCFGNTKIEPTDIDGFVERRGHFLVLETKRVGVPIPIGQERTFQAMLHSKLFTVIVVWGNKSPEYMKVYSGNKVTETKKCSLDDFRNVVKWWFRQVDKRQVM